MRAYSAHALERVGRIRSGFSGDWPGSFLARLFAVDSQRIDFISSYCDRWCGSCAFTERCSAFACDIAIAMCGDAAAGIELAVGRPKSPEGDGQPTFGETLMEEVAGQMPTEAEMADFGRQERERDERIEAIPLARMSQTYTHRSTAWIDAHC